MDEIEQNGWNLNIPRYVDTSEEAEEIDLDEVASEIANINKEIEDVTAELKKSFELLGLKMPF